MTFSRNCTWRSHAEPPPIVLDIYTLRPWSKLPLGKGEQPRREWLVQPTSLANG